MYVQYKGQVMFSGEDTMFDLNSSYIQKQWQGTTASRVGTAQVQLREEERDRATLRVG
jgi:hypothetical protein